MASLDAMHGGTRFSAAELKGQTDAMCELSNPPGYSRDAPDPKHRGQAMRSALSAEWLKSENIEMTGLWRRNVFERVRRDCLDSADKVFGSRFHYKIKRKRGEFDKY
jgi:hypothetical protein